MKKHNLILSTAIAMALGLSVSAASAGTLATAGTIFAVEDFGSASLATTGIQPGAATYTIGTTNGIVINAGGTIYITVRLAGGTFAAAPAAGTLTGTALAVGGAGNGVVGTPVLSSDSTTAMYPITYTAAATLGVGSTFIYTPAAAQVVGVNSTLATVGGKVTATVSMSAITPTVQAPSTTTAPNTGTAQAADIDSPAASGTLAIAAQGVSTAISALPGFSSKIDLTATPPSSQYTNGTGFGAGTGTGNTLLGSVTFTNATTAANEYNGTTPYTVAAAVAGTGTTKIVVTPGAGQSFPVGSILSIDSTAADFTGAGVPCTTTAAPVTAFTSATASAAATITVPAANVTTAVPIYLCLTKPSTGNTATPLTTSIAATLTPGIAATYGTDTASGTGFALAYNGSQVDVRSYVPVAAAGYTSFVRVINTGSVSAAVSVAVIDPVTGTPGTAASLTTLAAGAATTFTSAQIEAVTGAISGSTRPRLRFTAPTNGMNVQSFLLTNANGNFSDTTGAQ